VKEGNRFPDSDRLSFFTVVIDVAVIRRNRERISEDNRYHVATALHLSTRLLMLLNADAAARIPAGNNDDIY